MVEIHAVYQGELRCAATHMPSGTVLVTDAPVDNHGKGESFSPTDLVATALGTCILTTMAIAAGVLGVNLNGSTITVNKVMKVKPTRMIESLATVVTLMGTATPEQKEKLEHAAHKCPVHASMHPDVAQPITFHWPQ